ncbi:hypothetical protein JANAI62_31330 [Jannaschia pagri]|uniref:Group 4 capsule polysaccharide lipoprotein gfcB, YjbF n=1 Tax=Jannaschia pagri TaxID=2829797 RepID=A0ABQ4NQF2_9RHOB|nr:MULTISPECIES: YjbF family lipoprotein [unclassified Jannaschia]GIT92630.1 hypothetical protein JANAI61_30880 [Jannaschia sp. AI_61]GIT96510.1 hypothetical protein JANAI62_31330 [Jannaschia sp. AI_62]
MIRSRTLRLCACAAWLGVLAACSGGTNTDTGADDSVVSLAFGRLLDAIPLGGQTAEAPDPRRVLTGAAIAQSPTPVLMVVVQRTDIAFTMIPLTTNGDTVQWRDAAGGAIFMRDGLLVGTRALGNDLYGADVAPLAEALRAGGGQDVHRINYVLDGQEQVRAIQYLCDVRPVGAETLTFFGTSYRTTAYDEVCTGDGPDFTNRYWIDSQGSIRRSLERISDPVGAVEVSVLKR